MRRKDDTASIRKVRKDGAIEWRDKNGKFHRMDGPAYEDPKANVKIRYVRDKLHRDDGPAMDGPLGKTWYRNGKRHRLDGPAVEWADGRKSVVSK